MSSCEEYDSDTLEGDIRHIRITEHHSGGKYYGCIALFDRNGDCKTIDFNSLDDANYKHYMAVVADSKKDDCGGWF